MHTIGFEADGSDPRLPAWETGGLVLIDGNLTTAVPHVDGDDLPSNACGLVLL